MDLIKVGRKSGSDPFGSTDVSARDTFLKVQFRLWNRNVLLLCLRNCRIRKSDRGRKKERERKREREREGERKREREIGKERSYNAKE